MWKVAELSCLPVDVVVDVPDRIVVVVGNRLIELNPFAVAPAVAENFASIVVLKS